MNAIYALAITGVIAGFGYTITEILRQRQRIRQLEAELARHRLNDLARRFTGSMRSGTRC